VVTSGEPRFPNRRTARYAVTYTTEHFRGAALMTMCVGSTLLAGCAGQRKQARPATRAGAASAQARLEAPAALPADQQSVGWSATPLSVASQPVAVKEGRPPLVYLVESPGTFRVHDRTAGQDLARSVAGARSIVRVDARSGVVFGRETLLAGPLAKDHRYVIFLDPTGPNVARQGTFQVMPRKNGGGSRTRSGGQDQEGGQHDECE
jgi:hypothetical protein